MSSEWTAIRPWTPRLSLSVREITSVSVTFILASSLSRTSPHDPSLASLGIALEDEDEDGQSDTDPTPGCPTRSRRSDKGVVPEALAKGLSVNINGSPWQRVLIRIDDKADEAVIIIFGLLPGRQYDVELGLVQPGGAQPGQNSNMINTQVVTEDTDVAIPDSVESHDTSSTTSDAPASTPSTSPARTVPSTPPDPPSPSPTPSSPPPRQTLDDHLNHLHHNLSLLTSERDSLTASLKSTRRDSQKADSLLRAEIDVLRRTSEKYAVAEHRARQKVLALQEMAKRAGAQTREMEDVGRRVGSEVPELVERRRVLEAEHARLLAEEQRRRHERDGERESGKKKMEGWRGELGALGNKVERMNGKREKLEMQVIPELEEKLREAEEEIQSIERDPYGVDGDLSPNSPVPPARTFHQAPIQRPAPSRTYRHYSQSQNSPIVQILTNPNSASARAAAAAASISTSSTDTRPTTNVFASPPLSHANTTNTLSSRAPPFEPRNSGLRMPASPSATFSTPTATAAIPVPIGRPGRKGSGGM